MTMAVLVKVVMLPAESNKGLIAMHCNLVEPLSEFGTVAVFQAESPSRQTVAYLNAFRHLLKHEEQTRF